MDYESALHIWCSRRWEGKEKKKKKRVRGGEGTEAPSSRAVGGTVAPGCAAEGQLNGERAESWTVPVDSNNNGCACSTETMCSARGDSLTVCKCFSSNELTLTDAPRSFITGAGKSTVIEGRIRHAHTHTHSHTRPNKRGPKQRRLAIVICLHGFWSYVKCCVGNILITWAPQLITGNPVSKLSTAVITFTVLFQFVSFECQKPDCCSVHWVPCIHGAGYL